MDGTGKPVTTQLSRVLFIPTQGGDVTLFSVCKHCGAETYADEVLCPDCVRDLLVEREPQARAL